LVDIKKHEEMSRKLYRSLYEKILPFSDGVIIHPGHGAGSVCGGSIGSRDFSTLGYERKNNVWLDMDEEDFVQGKLRQNLTRAPYFKRCEKMNTNGPPLLPDPSELVWFDVDGLDSISNEPDVELLDTRLAPEFVKSHIPGSISLDIENMGLYAGWVLEEKTRFVFILGAPDEIDEASGMLYRVGLDNVVGALNGSLDDWKKVGKLVDSLPVYPLKEIRENLVNGQIQLVDVRQPHEAEVSHIEYSNFVPLTTIAEDMYKFEKDAKVAAICPVGVRSTTGASLMRRKGFKNAGITEEGLKVWKQKGYPISSE
jgi:hydroxyacylglutathione hydrolase